MASALKRVDAPLPQPTVQPDPDTALLGDFLALAGCGPAAPHFAAHLLREARTLGGALATSDFELARLGIPAAGRQVVAMLREVVALSLRREVEDRPCLASSAALIDYLHGTMAHARVESMRVLFLDIQNRLMRDELLIEGSVGQAPMFVRDIVKRALDVGASALVLVHNHPSGDPTPSKDDVDATHLLAQAALPLGISVHDHLIVSRCGYASLRSMGLLGAKDPRRAQAGRAQVAAA